MGITMLKIRRSWDHLYLKHGEPYTGKTTSLYWDDPQLVLQCALMWMARVTNRKNPPRPKLFLSPGPWGIDNCRKAPSGQVVTMEQSSFDLSMTYIWFRDASSLWHQNLSESENVSLHGQCHIPEEHRDISVSGSNETGAIIFES